MNLLFKSTLLASSLLLVSALPLKAATLPSESSLDDLATLLMTDPDEFLDDFVNDLPLYVPIESGALGIPNPETYVEDVIELISGLILGTPIDPDSPQGASLNQVLSPLDSSEEPFLLDVAIDGEVITTQQGENGYSETVVMPFDLVERYFRQEVSDVTTQTGIELGFSEEAQQEIVNELVEANNNQQENETQALSSEGKATGSNALIPILENSSTTSQSLATQSQQISTASQFSDTSFQLLRNISSQLGLQAQQTAQTSSQFTRLGEIVGNQSTQLAQQSKQFEMQQRTATQLLETAKQQQVLQSMQAVTQAESLQLADQRAISSIRRDQSTFNQLGTMSGVLMIPVDQQP